MKKLLIYAITLSMATPGFAKTKHVAKTHAPNLERGTLSSLVLSTEEFKRLTSDERTIYMMSMLALTEVLEISQDQVMDKMSSDKTARNTNPWHEFWAQALLNPAEAQGVLRALGEAGELAMTVGRSVTLAAPKLYQSVSNYASVAFKGLSGTKEVAETAAAASKFKNVGTAVEMTPVTGAYAAKGTMSAGNLGVEGATVANSAAVAQKVAAAGASSAKAAEEAAAAANAGSKAASATAAAKAGTTVAEKAAAALAASKTELEASIKAMKDAESAAKDAEKAFNAGKLGKAEYKAAIAAMGKSVTKMGSNLRKFMDKGGSSSEYTTMLNKAGIDKVPSVAKWSKLKLWGLGGGLAAVAGFGKYMTSDEGLTPDQAVKEAMAPQSAQIGAEATAAAAATTSASASAKTVAAPASEVGNSCVFGLQPSKWTNQNGQVLCTRPASSSNAKCNGAKFQCPSNGLADIDGSIEGKLCIDTQPLDTLTYRCSKSMFDILTTMKTTIKPEDYAKFAEHLKGFLTYVESKEGMKNEKNETKSILEYCTTDNKIQTNECEAIHVIVTVMQEYGSGNQIEQRTVAQADNKNAAAPATSAPPPPAGAPPAKAKGTN